MANICIIISIVLYLSFMVGVGVWYTKRNTSADDFYLGGRKLGPYVTAMSAEASDMSSWLLMGLPGLAFFNGLADPFWTAVGLSVGTYFNWLLVAKRLRYYSAEIRAITVPEFFSIRFGDKKRLLQGLAAVVIQGNNQYTLILQLVKSPTHGAAGPGTQSAPRSQVVTLMDMSQSQIMKTGKANLLRSYRAVGGGCLRGISVEDTNSKPFSAISPETVQQGGGAGTGKGRAIHLAIKSGYSDTLQGGAGKDMHILRPAFGEPWGAGGEVVMIARRNKDGNGNLIQRILHGLETFGCVRAIKDITAEKHQIAALSPCGSGYLVRDFQKRGF